MRTSLSKERENVLLRLREQYQLEHGVLKIHFSKSDLWIFANRL